MAKETGMTGRRPGSSSMRRSSSQNHKVIYYNSYTGERDAYVQGSAALDPFWIEESEEERHRKVTESTIAVRKNRENVSRMSRRTVLILGMLITLVTLSLILYIRLFAEISNTDKEVAALQTELAELRSSNDETYNEINNNIDLEAIRKTAINEFGMKYADENQVVEYSGAQGDSVHQVADVGR